jgi:hypothetical protein
MVVPKHLIEKYKFINLAAVCIQRKQFNETPYQFKLNSKNISQMQPKNYV